MLYLLVVLKKNLNTQLDNVILILSLFPFNCLFKSTLYLVSSKCLISVMCLYLFLCVGSHARLRCMCTCNRCTFCLCQNFLNSELMQTVRTKLYTVVFSRFSGCFIAFPLCFVILSSLFIDFFLHYSHADSHSFSFIQLFVLAWHNVLINF